MIAFAAIIAFIRRFWIPLLIVVAAVILIGIGRRCGSENGGGVSRETQEHLENANTARENRVEKQGELKVREEIRANANKEVNAAYDNLNRVSNANYNVTGSELDRLADERRRERANQKNDRR